MNRPTCAALACFIVLVAPGRLVAADDGSVTQPVSGSCPVHRLPFLEGGTANGAEQPYARGHWGGDTASPLMAYLRELDLSVEQHQSMQAIGQRFRDRAIALMQRSAEARDRMRTVMPDDPAYAAAIAAAAQSAATLAADGVMLFGEMRAELHTVLTEAQRQQLRERATADRQRWDEWRSRHQSQQ